ncbi:AIPR family protein [Spirosoma pollinicola]|uniref:Abortive phage resistance protein n=1 Tax=Spirosoma pollinicola TaxID=2057025 RepID=A0A2K8YY08_9BACT|nr:AIPR family protein [Spirosoma pollinicola]AUD02428.1 abortive phage resistance protein [Spirosoma pollinicola]
MSTEREQTQLLQFYTDLRQRINATAEAGEQGGFKEEIFTSIVLDDYLSATGDTENARECRDVKENAAGQKMHKINGYALSEGAENLDLFVTIYKGYDEPQRIGKEEITSAFNQCRRFLNNAFKGYWQDMDESASAYDFAKEICHNRNALVRANLFILTDGECSVEPSQSDRLDKTDLLLTYRIIDIRYLARIEQGEPTPIFIDFVQRTGKSLPCLPIPTGNDQYETYLAAVPGDILANVYEEYGARLLEMNVRSFLQFTVGTNKGIRQTILKEPHMFLAYNNGIAATAESVELTPDNRAIKSLTGLQIVNGGQTTASIFYTHRKDKADVSGIYVQMKLSVIKTRDDVGSIVNNISRYANTQNKVSESDLSANNPFHTELEKLSRTIWTPAQSGQSYQTHWFYERARAQYKNALAREFSAANRKKFELQNPRKQLFVKEDLAKYVNVWNELPWHVVRGSQKNYGIFMTNLKTKDQKPTSVFFEDSIAKAVLFRTAEEVYGRQPKAIGDLRYVTVPYTLAWLSRTLNGRLDLLKIWKQQRISDALRALLYDLMVSVEKAIKASATGALYGEWAKKEDCWKQLRGKEFPVDLSSIYSDLIDPANPPIRKSMTDDDTEKLQQLSNANWLCSIPAIVWEQICEWGRLTNKLTFHQQQISSDIAKKIRQWKDQTTNRLTTSEINSGLYVIELVIEHAPQLLENMPDDTSPIIHAHAFKSSEKEISLSLELIKEAVAWDRRHKILSIKYHLLLKSIAEERTTLNSSNRQLTTDKIVLLISRGFSPTA